MLNNADDLIKRGTKIAEDRPITDVELDPEKMRAYGVIYEPMDTGRRDGLGRYL